MPNYKKNFFNILSAIVFVAIILSISAITNAKTSCPAKTIGECVVIEASTPAPTTPSYLAVTYSTYLDNLYIYLLGLVGIGALGTMVYGGVLYITAAANPSKMGEAKQRIWNGILGILLAGFSYVILSTINPDLVGGFNGLDLSKYLPNSIQQPSQSTPPQPITCPAGGTPTAGSGGFLCPRTDIVPQECRWTNQAACSSVCPWAGGCPSAG